MAYGIALVFGLSKGLAGRGFAAHATALGMVAMFYAGGALFMIWLTTSRIRTLRHREKPLAIIDMREPILTKPKRKVRIVHESRLHPLALPIWDNALAWKETAKPGYYFSLTWQWYAKLLGFTVAALLFYWYLRTALLPFNRDLARAIPRDLSFLTIIHYLSYTIIFTSYFMLVPTYILCVVFQTTASVVYERELCTLDFLLQLPIPREEILFWKWLGPHWRNWPTLGLILLGVGVGGAMRLYGVDTMGYLILTPMFVAVFLSSLALCLSTVCRRVLYANIILILLMVGLIMARAMSPLLPRLNEVYGAIFTYDVGGWGAFPQLNYAMYRRSVSFYVLEMSALLLLAALLALVARAVFRRRTSETRGLSW
jgi:ABC-type transport system involved in multi-copper enzyme maturation permease subunit